VKRFVLDASVALGWFLEHPVAQYANRVKQTLLLGARAVVPALWHLEMANGFAVAERRGILTAADADRCLVNLEQLLAQAIESETEFFPVRQAHLAARTSQLSAYDAVYLITARRAGLPLATLDQRLRAAASSAGVELFA
jgi:predicted nucleic acid-binding protein